MAAIELEGVSKQFGTVTALQDVDLTVEDGEVFGFLGPNGAGKSTTINVLLDFVRPTAGTARVLGHDAREESRRIREQIGVLPEGYDIYDRLTGLQHLDFVIESKDADADPLALLDRVGLDADDAARRAGGYSKGMKQRLVLAMALVGEPDLLILDEPSTGLDPNGARTMREIVREESERGATIFFSSHILGQVEAVCDTVGIMQEGRLIAKDTVSGLRDAVETDSALVVSVQGSDDEIAAGIDAVEDEPTVSAATRDGDEVRVHSDADEKMTVLNTLESAGAEVVDFETEAASLDDVFAAYTETGEDAEVEA